MRGVVVSNTTFVPIADCSQPQAVLQLGTADRERPREEVHIHLRTIIAKRQIQHSRLPSASAPLRGGRWSLINLVFESGLGSVRTGPDSPRSRESSGGGSLLTSSRCPFQQGHCPAGGLGLP